LRRSGNGWGGEVTALAQHAQHTDQFPALRADVTLSDGGHDGTGAAGLVLHDPVRHRFYRLPGAMAALLNRGSARGGTVKAEADAEALATFLQRHRLTEGANAASLMQEWQAAQRSLMMRLLHSYLSFRVPLINPEPLLDHWLPLARLLASRGVLLAFLTCGLAGLYFAGRQWQHFLATFVDFFTPQGAVLYGVTLVGLKVFHELGHGFVARHFGCHVPVMGVNFLVLTPMLYTDASDAWRLSSRRQRFLIGAAGVLTEMALASLALLLWAFLPDGPARSAAYFVAATAWIMSVLVNLSPFMRFDGYHMLVDATGLHSIGPRAFALATWGLRQMLFNTAEAMPEFHPVWRRRALMALAWGTWIYRLGVFSGIALLVYQMFPKALGLPLAAIEVHWFIFRPVIRELTIWKGMGVRRLVSTRRAKVSLAALALCGLLAALPLDRHVTVPALLGPAQEMRLFAPEAAQVVALHVAVGDSVKAGDILAELVAPEISHRRRLAEVRLAIVAAKLARLAADAGDRAQSLVLARERAAIAEELKGLAAREDVLVLRAAFTGRVAERMEGLAKGQWVGNGQMLFHIVAPGGAALTGLVAEWESGRLSPGALAHFISDDGMMARVEARLAVIGNPGGEGVVLSYLSARQGGPITMAPDPDHQGERPVQGYLPAVFAAEGPAPPRALRGQAVVEAAPQSLLGFAMGRVVTVVLRESGF
jgi:putative peptide zinc metalloprotease protein